MKLAKHIAFTIFALTLVVNIGLIFAVMFSRDPDGGAGFIFIVTVPPAIVAFLVWFVLYILSMPAKEKKEYPPWYVMLKMSFYTIFLVGWILISLREIISEGTILGLLLHIEDVVVFGPIYFLLVWVILYLLRRFYLNTSLNSTKIK